MRKRHPDRKPGTVLAASCLSLTALTVSCLTASALTSTALAEVKTADFTGIDTVSLDQFIATVSITVGQGDTVQVSVDDRNGGKEPVLFEKKGDSLVIYSKKRPDQKTLWRQLNWQRDGSEAFRNFLEDYPTVQITLPAGTDISASRLATQVTIGDVLSDLSVSDTIYMEGTVGDLLSADIEISGAGDLVLGSVSENMRGQIAGSGSLSFETVGSADISIAGSGDVAVRSVRGPANVSIRGSGDVVIGDIGGNAELDIAGSGDIETGDIAGGLATTIRGSGDIQVASVDGPVDVGINGNGDVSIDGGNALGMSVTINGSGDLEFRGIAQDPTVSIRGSGDIFIQDYTGKVSTSGSGDIVIGDIVIDD